MRFRFLKYLLAFILPATVAISFLFQGIWVFLPVFFAFIFIPVLELIIGSSAKNLESMEAELVRKDRWYDAIIYLTVPVQSAVLIWFLFIINEPYVPIWLTIFRVINMGLMCGVFGINVAHELGHRNKPLEKILSKIMLCSSLYMHFYIEHNRGHHRNVGTADDPASATLGESIYAFWLRTITKSFVSAWNIVKKERLRKQLPTWSLNNEMIQYLLIELSVCLVIGYIFGPFVLFCFLCASLIGILLLEAVNYIEHYGLRRTKISEFRYEDIQPWHSWNSDHIVGRLILFELTRHSDHHSEPSKPYQVLNSMKDEKNLPAGYPAMIITSLFPPLWFAVMNKRVSNSNK